MPKERSIDIDNIIDFELAKIMFKKNFKMDNIKNIKLILVQKYLKHSINFMIIKKIICVLDNKEKVIGTLTEGDFLKAIWKKIDFKKDLLKILNKKFFYTYDKKIKKRSI